MFTTKKNLRKLGAKGENKFYRNVSPEICWCLCIFLNFDTFFDNCSSVAVNEVFFAEKASILRLSF